MNLMRTAMLLAFMTALFMGVGYLIGGQSGMMIAFVAAAGMNFFSYWNSDRMVLSTYGAQEVDERSAPEFYGIVRDLARNAGLPMPKVYLYDNPQPNAFATGRNPQNAAVAASTGLLHALTPQEVAGVMAHELAHVQNRDTLTMTITATLAGAISMLGNFAFFSVAAAITTIRLSHRRARGDDRRSSGRHAGADGDQPDARIFGRPPRRGSAAIRSGSPRRSARSPVAPRISRTRKLRDIRRRRICSSSIRSLARAWTICFPRIRTRKTASPRCMRWRSMAAAQALPLARRPAPSRRDRP